MTDRFSQFLVSRASCVRTYVRYVTMRLLSNALLYADAYKLSEYVQVNLAIRKRWKRYRAQRLGNSVGRRRSSRTSSVYVSTSDVSVMEHATS